MPPRILIAEDDDLQGAVLRSALERRGYEAEIVTDGLQAVRLLRTGRFDLALLDYHLPEVDGLAAARLLHDHFSEADRPGLIAVTATVEGLSEKEIEGGGTSFDAVVSKRLGLSALLSVVDANLTSMAERQAEMVITRRRAAKQVEAARRRRRLLAPVAAVPALTMVAAFTAAFVWGVASLSAADGAFGSAQRAAALVTNAGALLNAIQDAETSQRSYLATGAPDDLTAFQADAQQVDQLLAGAAPLAADGAPGLGAAGPQDVITPRLRALAEEAQARPAIDGASPAPSAAEGRDITAHLREWASGLVTGSQAAVLTGLDAVRRNMLAVLAVLAVGILYGVLSAVRAFQRRWNATAPPPSSAVLWPRPPPPVPHWATGPLLASHAD